jgi:hypothetical protein
MLLPRACTQSLFIRVVIASVLVSTLNASAADATTSQPTSYSQKTERLIFNPANLGFGSVSAGEQKVQTVTITNAGNSEIKLLQVIAAGTDFSLAGLDLPLILAGGESFTFSVLFAPRAPGESSGSISFISARAGASNRILMSGSAIAAKQVTDNDVSGTRAVVAESLNGVGAGALRHKVDLSWHASTSKGVIGYNIYRGEKSGGPYRKLNSALDKATAYTDTSVVNGTIYYYVATTVNSRHRESAYSRLARAKIP